MKTYLYSLVLGALLVMGATVGLASADANCPGVGNDCTQTINNGGAGGNASAAAAAAASSSATAVSNPVQINTQLQNQGQQQGQHQGQAQGQQQGQAQGQKQQANNDGNHQDVRIDVPRQAPPAVPSGLAVSSLTCYGSWSIAATTPFGGVGAGFPTKDEDCERARNAMIFVNLGMPQVALALLGQNDANARAMEAAGVKYPGQKVAVIEPEKVSAVSETAKTVQAVVEPTDIPTAMRATLARAVEGVQGN